MDFKSVVQNLMGDQGAPPPEGYPQDSCASHALGLCPYDVLLETRNGMGPCPRPHHRVQSTLSDEATSRAREEISFALEVVADRVRAARTKLSADTAAAMSTYHAQLEALALRGDEALAEMSRRNDQGDIDGGYGCLGPLAELRAQYGSVEAKAKGCAMRYVCDVCGGVQSVGRSDVRQWEIHSAGRHHAAVVSLREAMESLCETSSG
jgi:LUC7 N_terminus